MQNKKEHVLAESPIHKRLKAKLQQRKEKEETKQITDQASQSGDSPFFAKYTGYKALTGLKDPLDPNKGEIIVFNATDTEEQCYNWTTLTKGQLDAMESFKQGACNLTAFDTDQSRDGYEAFTGYIPLISWQGSVTIKTAGKGTHNGYQTVGAMSAGAAFTAAQLDCVDSVIRDGVVPFIDSTNGYAGCPAPASKLDAATAGAVFGGVTGGAVCLGLGWAAHKTYKQHRRFQESTQPLISASSSSSATATAAPAATAAPQPRKSWCPSFSFLSAGRQAPAPAAAPGYNALAESEASAPSATRVLPLEVESGSRFSIQQ